MNAQPCVLIVEDNDVNRKLFGRLARRCGARAISVASGRAAIEKFHEAAEQIDLMITDQHLPDIAGTMLIAHLRKHRPDLPAIVVSGSAVELPERSYFLLKPFSPHSLIAVLQQQLATL